MKGENNTSDVVDYAEFVLRATHYYNAATPAIEVREIGNKSKYKLYGKGGSSIYWVGAEPGSHQATNGKNGNAGCGGGGGQYPNSGASSGQSLGGSGGAACVWIYY